MTASEGGDLDRSELVRRLFTLLTAKLEDGAGEAVRGQSRGLYIEETAALGQSLELLGEEIITLARAAYIIVAAGAP